MNKTNFISSLNYAGLGNRINTLISDIFIYDAIYPSNDKLIHWPIIKDKFEDLFEPIDGITFTDTYDKNKYKIDSKICNKKEYNRNPNGFLILKEDIEKLKNIKSYYVVFNQTIYYTYNNTPQFIIDRYLKYITKIVPKKNIRNEANNYWMKYKNMEMDNIVGVHIRQGDFNKFIERKVDVDRFISKMKEIKIKNKKTVFYVSSDDRHIINRLTNIFSSESIITYEHTQDSKSHSDFKTALICLLILSKPKHLILTNYSTYSQLAWWLGGCQAKVDIITNEYQDNLAKSNEVPCS